LFNESFVGHADLIQLSIEEQPMKRIAWTSFAVVVLLLANSCGRVSAADKGHGHEQAFAACAKACADCMNSCASCYHHCGHLLSEGEKDHAKTMVLCNDCAEVCSTAAKLTARHSPFASVICEACAKTCDECGAACAKHPQDEHMSECAKACQECATACREMIQHVSK
jgi:Domain of Unknown Function (DUF326)